MKFFLRFKRGYISLLSRFANSFLTIDSLNRISVSQLSPLKNDIKANTITIVAIIAITAAASFEY